LQLASLQLPAVRCQYRWKRSRHMNANEESYVLMKDHTRMLAYSCGQGNAEDALKRLIDQSG